MPDLTILFDGIELFNRTVDAVECETTAAGKVSLNADFPPIEFEDFGLPTGTIVTGILSDEEEE